MGNEYFSFEKVLKELQLDEEELKRMVSEGQIRAFRDEDKMKFRMEDVEGLRKGRQTDPTIILPGSGVEAAEGAEDEIALVEDDTSETLLDLDEAAAEEAPAPKPAARGGSSRPAARKPEPEPEPEEEAPAGASTLDEELVLDDDAALSLEGDDEDQVGTQPMAAATQETFVDEDEEVGMTTEPLELVDEDEPEEKKPAAKGRKSGAATARDADDDKPKTVVASKRETVRAPARSGRNSGARPAQVSHLGWTMGLVACWVLLLYGFFIFVELLGKPGGSSVGAPVAKMVNNMFLKEDWEKDKLGRKAAKADAGDEGGGDEAAGAGE